MVQNSKPICLVYLWKIWGLDEINGLKSCAIIPVKVLTLYIVLGPVNSCPFAPAMIWSCPKLLTNISSKGYSFW